MTNAQEPQKAVLVDEFGADVVCENLASHLDYWAAEIMGRPDEVGYAIVRGPANKLLQRMNRSESIRGQLLWRFYKHPEMIRRFVIIEGAYTPEIDIKLYRSKPNDQAILSQEAKWDLTFPIKKPFAFYKSMDDGAPCPSTDDRKQLVDLVWANPSYRGHVVFHVQTFKEFAKLKKEFLKKVGDVPSSRFRFFGPRSYHYSGHYEYWLVPSKRP